MGSAIGIRNKIINKKGELAVPLDSFLMKLLVETAIPRVGRSPTSKGVYYRIDSYKFVKLAPPHLLFDIFGHADNGEALIRIESNFTGYVQASPSITKHKNPSERILKLEASHRKGMKFGRSELDLSDIIFGPLTTLYKLFTGKSVIGEILGNFIQAKATEIADYSKVIPAIWELKHIGTLKIQKAEISKGPQNKNVALWIYFSYEINDFNEIEKAAHSTGSKIFKY